MFFSSVRQRNSLRSSNSSFLIRCHAAIIAFSSHRIECIQSIFNQAIYRIDEKKNFAFSFSFLNMSFETSAEASWRINLIRSIYIERDDIINRARGAYFVITDNLSFKWQHWSWNLPWFVCTGLFDSMTYRYMCRVFLLLSLSRAHLFVSKKLKMRRIKHVIEKKDKIEIQYLFDVYFDGSWDIVPFNNRAY